MSRSVTMQGPGAASSSTSAAPVPFSVIIVAASRSVCVGPTVRTTSDIPSRTSIWRLPSWVRELVRIASSLPDHHACTSSFPGGRTYRLRRASRCMYKLANPIRLLLVFAALTAVALPASGCGTSSADPTRGRVLFIQKCGVCHAMAEAGTTAQIGPNLDDAFAASRAAGEGGDTVEGVVKAQVEFPRPSNSDPAVSMPADVVSGQDLEDVAAYVGLYAGVPGAAPPKVPGGPGAQVFANNGCGGCHTLAAAKSGGVTGPNLDEVLPGQSAAMIEESIVDPNAHIAKGYPANVMPSNFETLIKPQEIEQLVEYLISSTAKGGGSKG